MTNDKEDLRGGMKESKTLVDGLIQRKKVLRMGVYDYFWPDTLRNWLEQGYPQDASGSPANPEEVFDFDLRLPGVGLTFCRCRKLMKWWKRQQIG